MALAKHLLTVLVAAAMALAMPASAAPWVRGYVVSQYEYAFYYGGKAGFTRPGEIEPGSDCPHGSTRHFSSATYIREALKQQPWRSQEEVENITNPPGVDTVKQYLLTRFFVWNRAVAYRGFRKGIETYVNPFAAPDPGEPEVTGKIAEGFDLDDNPNTGGFTGPDGRKGIDNALYRAWGCDAPWRGGNATLDLRANDKMQEGLYTMVIRISGNQDPMNDDDATVEIGYSPDHIMKDASSAVATDYSYRIAKREQYTKLKARIENGVVETEQVAELHSPRIAWFPDQTGDADFHQGRLHLVIDPEGNAGGLIGGYRDWRDLYAENTFAQDGGQQGIREHEDAIALYYAVRRNADGMRDPKTGRNMGISCAYRIKAVPAFVVDPSTPVGITAIAGNEHTTKAFQGIRAAFIEATTTRSIQDVPPGTTEAAPRLDKKGSDIYILELPNGAYLQKILDRPPYSDEAAAPGESVPPPAPVKRADNAAPAIVASAP